MDFRLNQEIYENAEILVAGNNFGCGSSREHAVWAILQQGFKVVIASSAVSDGEVILRLLTFFVIIGQNGLLTIELPEAAVREIMEIADVNAPMQATVNLVDQKVICHTPAGEKEHAFNYDEFERAFGYYLDEIGLTLQHESDIATFEETHDVRFRNKDRKGIKSRCCWFIGDH